MLAMGNGEITTGGYGPDFLNDWIRKRKKNRDIITDSAGYLAFSEPYVQSLHARLKELEG
jgi:hypothetical protein